LLVPGSECSSEPAGFGTPACATTSVSPTCKLGLGVLPGLSGVPRAICAVVIALLD
jgi:hypothetical protein